MIEVILNDRLGKKVRVAGHAGVAATRRQRGSGGVSRLLRLAPCPQIRVKCNEDDTIGDLKKMVAAQTGAARRPSAALQGCRLPHAPTVLGPAHACPAARLA